MTAGGATSVEGIQMQELDLPGPEAGIEIELRKKMTSFQIDPTRKVKIVAK